ncbi:hypothetical protein KBTX_02630 [wastewater metagenome]|uniref:Tripartite ATP-independent periplasmic transporters DctQ component domain-containing protein n=2 Tax=unclassified sequences TaxID=12908 RepID=A0A5B8REF5_9ZZZZ|nr:hypothetical protein KBTEX_02630 [uncultured organism]
MVRWVLRVEHVSTRIALLAAVAMLTGAVCLAFYQVVTRFLLEAPSTWSEVSARSLMIWCVFLGAAASFRTGSMMAVEAVYSLVPARWHLSLEALIGLLCIVFLLVLVWYGGALTYRVRFQTLSGLGVSISWVYAALPVGGVFALLAVVSRLLALACGLEGRTDSAAVEEG